MKSARFQVKSTGFHEIHNEIRSVSFCVMIKYRSFEKRKTNQSERQQMHDVDMYKMLQ